MRTLRLKDFGRWYSGGTPPRDTPEHWEGDIPWISAKDIASTRLRSPTAFITRDAAEQHSKIVPPGALLLIVRGMAVVHGLPVVQVREEVAFNQDLRALVCRLEVYARFAYYALIGHRWLLDAHIDRAAHGTARVADAMYSERIPVPELPAQRAIADFLDQECERIEALRKETSSYSRDLATPALEAFRRLTDAMPRGRIGYAFEVQLGKMLDEKRVDRRDVSPYLRNANVHWDRLVLDDLKEMTFTAAEKRKFNLQPGDLLVCEGGEPGRAAVWNEELEDCYFQKALHRVRPYRDGSVRFLLWSLRDLSARGAFRGDGPGRYTHLTADQLRAVRVPMPDPKIQEVIAARVDTQAKTARTLESEADSLAALLADYRDALITEAVTGQVDVTRLSVRQMEENLDAVVHGEQPEVLTG